MVARTLGAHRRFRSAGPECTTCGRGFFSQYSLNWHLAEGSRPGHLQFSLLISFELPTIPPPTTVLPFRHDRFSPLLQRRSLPRLSPGEIQRIKGFARRAVKGSHIASRLPDRLGRIEFTCVADWSFVSGCSPPFLTETQLPLSTTGR